MIQAYGCLPAAWWHSSIIKTFIIFSLIKLCLKQESNIAGVITSTCTFKSITSSNYQSVKDNFQKHHTKTIVTNYNMYILVNWILEKQKLDVLFFGLRREYIFAVSKKNAHRDW